MHSQKSLSDDVGSTVRSIGPKQAQKDSETRARDILQALPAAIYTTDAKGRITFFNQAASDLAGTKPRVGIDEWCVTWRLYQPDGTPLAHDACPMALTLMQGEPVLGAEAIAERPDGTRFPFQPYPALLHDAEGNVTGAINMLVDISERKRAEARQAELTAELNHRVKNTLAIVQSIASQTARSSASLEDFLGEFEGRLMALGRAHDLLTLRRWEGADLGEVLRQELAPFGAEETGPIQLDGPELTLKPAAATGLAMAFHELATNAARHGCLSAPEGRVTLSWRPIQTGDGTSAVLLEWTESGGPPITPSLARGFGLRLVERTVAGDLNGTCDLELEPSGLRWRLVIPTADLCP